MEALSNAGPVGQSAFSVPGSTSMGPANCGSKTVLKIASALDMQAFPTIIP